MEYGKVGGAISTSLTKVAIPKKLKYQFGDDFNINLSDLCCYKLKKEVASQYQEQSGKKCVLTGMRSDEGGERENISCIVTEKDGSLKKFHPLLVVNDEFENEFIKENNIEICKLYLPPYNFKRTGCKGCPFSLDLQKQLDVMEKYLPNEKKQCEYIWKPIYDEYRRIGYRLRKNGMKQLSLFD